MASIALKQTTAARGAPVYVTGSGFTPGHTVAFYIHGRYSDVKPTNTVGALVGNFSVPDDVAVGAARPVLGQDNTNLTNATTTLTIT